MIVEILLGHVMLCYEMNIIRVQLFEVRGVESCNFKAKFSCGHLPR